MHNYNFGLTIINIHSLFTNVGFLPSISAPLPPQENLPTVSPPYPQQFNNGAPYPH